jgi:GNAT superfamily N-acetyltransferase
MRLEIQRLSPDDARAVADDLAGILVDAVENGDSISFRRGLTRDEARAFVESLLPEVEEGRRVLLGARLEGALVGTVQIAHAWQPNSPHRAEVVKLVVHRSGRGRGVGRALMQRLEEEARADGRTLLVLDTVAGSVADGMYERLGWTRVGVVPRYAESPDGVLCDAAFFYKEL